MGAIASFLSVAWQEHGDKFMWVGGVVAMCGVLWKWPIRPALHRLREMFAFMERLDKVIGAVEETLLTNNGGSTILDKTEATHRLAQETAHRLSDLITKLEKEKS